ncbi:MAG: DUF1573 domain-containing protein [Nitrosopumilus sp.]
MSKESLQFESRTEKYLVYGLVGIIIILMGVTFFPMVKTYIPKNSIEDKTINTGNEISLSSPKDYYNMFQCPCCGKPIDTNCCGMAKQRKDYVDKLLLDGLEGTEVAVEMVKKFGFGTLMSPSQEQEIKNFIKSNAPDNPPKIMIENSRYDFGTISQKDGIASTMFTIKNTGGSDLVIDNIDTSCMCTTASLIYKGKESPEFGMSMHGNNPKNFELRIQAGETAQLKVYYDPNAHGIQKEPQQRITREVTIMSNDPIDFQKKVRIDLTQVP